MHKRLCAIQMHYTDIFPGLKENNCVSTMIQSGLFDDVVIVAADVEQNKVLQNYASDWGVELHLGAVENVTQRLFEISQKYGANSILRVLPQWYFIDVAFVESMLETLESQDADYLIVPTDFDFRFGGDVFSGRFLETLLHDFENMTDCPRQYLFNPWGYVNAFGHPSLKLIEHKDVPQCSNDDFVEFRARYNDVWPEQWDKADTPQAPYKMCHEYISNDMAALDIACGHGSGSKFLIDQGCQSVVGVDVSQAAIDHCQNKFLDDKRLSFHCGDALGIDFVSEQFDLIVTIHTMEHVSDDMAFLDKLKSWLKPGGTIVLEVPLLMRLPFKDSDQPFSDGHIREYYPRPLVDLFQNFFMITKQFGVSRGFYVEPNKARNAMMIIGQRT
ncbi:MAG: methyltransferase domain-containing protein [Magnetovibrio sp.]|nr:methyltransferase domain-containing protein [Magnetovibrio sp.]